MNDNAAVIEYRGETAPRSPLTATLLTALHPSLGYLYVGRSGPALVAAVAFTLYLTLFMTLWATLQFFPLLPLLVLAAGWLILSMICLASILRDANQQGQDYLLRKFNHPVIYAVTYVIVGMIPLLAFYHLSTQTFWGIVKVNEDSMAPSIVTGDTLLIDRLAYQTGHAPQRGEEILVAAGDDGQRNGHVILGRVVGVAGDTVSLKGGGVVVNDQALERRFYGEDGMLPDDALAGEPAPFGERIYIETHGEKRYVIAGDLPPMTTQAAKPVTLDEGQLALLGDHRANAGSRPLITVKAERVIGRPRYILYSEARVEGQDTMKFRWSRVGLRVE